MNNVIGAYAAYTKDDNIRIHSSSGGIFSLLAEKIINMGGAVYGVAMSIDCKSAEFIRVSNKEELAKLRGSKYFQAKVGQAYMQVKKDLESGLPVLFSGTGCQVNGLKGYLGKEYDNLYCVDVICHGVPSPNLWRNYVAYREREAKGKLTSISFRCKDDSWADFGMKIIDVNHKAVYISKDKDPFMLMFLRDYCLRPSCYECIAKKEKLSDLTIADFWGIDNVMPKMNDGKGVSLVITRTNKGQELFDAIDADIVCAKTSYEDGVRSNPADYMSAKKPVERETFFVDMDNIDFEGMWNKYATIKPIPIKRRIKKIVKQVLLKTPVGKFIGGGYKTRIKSYGLLFVFETESNI